MTDVKYHHATCNNVHPLGSLEIGDEFKALCGETVVKKGPEDDVERCPDCLEKHHEYMIALMTGDEYVVCLCGRKAVDHE